MAMRASWTRGALMMLLLNGGSGRGLAPEIFVGAHSEPRGDTPERDAGTARGEDASPRSVMRAPVWRMTPAPSRLTMLALRWVTMLALRWVPTPVP
jgi:hypothetical protein